MVDLRSTEKMRTIAQSTAPTDLLGSSEKERAPKFYS